MAKLNIQINSILGGIAVSEYFGQKGSFSDSLGIDPDMPIADSGETKLSGLVRPTAMEKFSGSTVTGSIKWIRTNPKTSDIYAYADDGKIHSVSSSLSMDSDIGTLTSATGNGFGYYDNYVYAAKNTDIARIGPMNGTVGINQSYWAGTLSKSVLTNTTYPSINGIQMPNHPMHRHVDGKLYIGDVLSDSTANTNKGALHFIKTTKATVEGDTNNGSTYNAIDFGYGYYPTAIETYGNDLAVALMEGTNTATKQMPAAVAFWDTTSVSFQKIIQVEFPDPLITAMKNVNGVLYVWSGSASGGCRLSRFVGGYSFEEVSYMEDIYPPLQGAVDAEQNKIIFGTYSTTFSKACVFSYGSKIQEVGNGLQNTLISTGTGSNLNIGALRFATQSSFAYKAPIVAWRSDSAYGIDKLSTTYSNTCYFRSEEFKIGQPFQINSLRIPLVKAVVSGMSVTPKIYLDNKSTSETLNSGNFTNFPGKKNLKYQNSPLAQGEHGFILELAFDGTALTTVALPITLEVETLND